MAVESTADLITQLRAEWAFDATDTQLLGWLNQKHRLMVTRSRCYREDVTIGPTVAGQGVYSLPADVLEMYVLTVDGVPYNRTRLADLRGLQAEMAQYRLVGFGGVFAQGASSVNAEEIEVYPLPGESGLAITGFASTRGPELASGGQAPVVPAEFFDQLLAGAAAIGLARIDKRSDLAREQEAKFDQGCDELRRQVRRRLGSGVKQIPIVWP